MGNQQQAKSDAAVHAARYGTFNDYSVKTNSLHGGAAVACSRVSATYVLCTCSDRIHIVINIPSKNPE
jgi:hypothetical protein